MDWVETELYKSEFLPKVLPTPELEYWFKLASASLNQYSRTSLGRKKYETDSRVSIDR